MALTKISTDGVKDDAITKAKIPANQIETSEISSGAVTSTEIADNTIVDGDISDATISLSKLEHGTSSNDGKFLRANNGADPSFETVNTDLSADSSPQLGGDLDTNSHNINLDDNHKVNFGDSNDLNIYHQSGIGYIDDLVGSGDGVTIRAKNIRLQSNANVGAKSAVNCNANAAVELFHNDVKQLETHESGIILPKGCMRGQGGSKVLLGGTIDPSADKVFSFSFNTNAHGYNSGYVFNVKFYMNHWNHGDYYKYIEFIYCGRGNTTSNQRVNLINNLGTGSASWSNAHIDGSTVLSGGSMNGNNAAIFNVTYDADGAPSYTSGYILEVSHSGQIGSVTIT